MSRCSEHAWGRAGARPGTLSSRDSRDLTKQFQSPWTQPRWLGWHQQSHLHQGLEAWEEGPTLAHLHQERDCAPHTQHVNGFTCQSRFPMRKLGSREVKSVQTHTVTD